MMPRLISARVVRGLLALLCVLVLPALGKAQSTAPSPKPDQVSVIAQFVAKPGQERALRAKLLAMIAPTRAESGCISYDLHVSQADPAQFIFLENWKNQQVLDAHMKTPHFLKYITNGTPALLVAPSTVVKGRIVSDFVPKTQSDPRLRGSASLTLVPFFTVKPDKFDQVLKAHQAMIAPTRMEKGYISYDLYQSRENESVLYFVENWTSKAALKAHMMTKHYAAHVHKIAEPGLAVPFTYLLLKRISPPGVGQGAK